MMTENRGLTDTPRGSGRGSDRSTELSLDEVAQIYLKQRRFWSDGSPIVPINREAGSRARRIFTDAVFAQQARHHDVYWNRQYFKGVLPPATLASAAPPAAGPRGRGSELQPISP